MNFFRNLFFLRFLCGVFVAPIMFMPAFADDTPGESDIETNDTQDENQLSIETAEDDGMDEIFQIISELGWCPDDADQIKDSRKADLCKKIKALESTSVDGALAANTDALAENYQNMRDKEKSWENRMLSAAGIGTVGIGGMMAAQSLAEQSADAAAERDMQAYIATMQCKIGESGGTPYSVGTTNIEIGGANQLINLYQEYATLAGKLKEQKSALGLTPGIEAEIVIDKASSGLYDNVGSGIGSGAYASIARALMIPNGTDAARWHELKEKTSTKLKTGAGIAAAGAVASMAANYAINHNNKDKSGELLAERAEIKESYNNLAQQIINECNQRIREHKEYVKTLTSEQLAADDIREYKSAVDNAHEINDISEITNNRFCR